jgi:hypothetical protein
MTFKIGWLQEAENNLGTWLHEADDWQKPNQAGWSFPWRFGVAFQRGTCTKTFRLSDVGTCEVISVLRTDGIKLVDYEKDHRQETVHMSPLFSPRVTLTLAVCFVVPFGLRLLAPRLEPYPAVLLPSGAGKIHVGDGRVEFTSNQVWALSPDRRWQRVDCRELLRPIPVQYLGMLVNNKFGLRDDVQAPVTLKKLGLRLPIGRPPATAEHKNVTKRWLAAGLSRLGLSAEVLRVTTVATVVAVPSGETLESHTIGEDRYALD